MQVAAGQPFTTSLVAPAGDITGLGARVEVPVTRAIVTAFVFAARDGATWTVTLDPPVDPGDYELVWRTSDPEPPDYETFIPLTVTAAGVTPGDGGTGDGASPVLVPPTVQDVAMLAHRRTVNESGKELGTFDATTRPTDIEVDLLIDQAMIAIGGQPSGVRSTHNVTLYAAILLESSFYGEQVDEGSVSVWQDLLARAGFVIETGSGGASAGEASFIGPTRLA
jgi:hypothetical protein